MKLNENVNQIVSELASISRKGPIEARGKGPSAVGMTLLAELGIPYETKRKPNKNGIVVSARRGTKAHAPNRVNLFAKVPNWKISDVNSSAEILERYGYDRDGERRLNCTVSAREPNTQGLKLWVDRANAMLHEHYCSETGEHAFASWYLSDLQEKLAANHPETIWVSARATKSGEQESFHYRYATYSGAARVELLPELISQGTITMDHLINNEKGKVTEKGPLFKIKPTNLRLLFLEYKVYDLMSL